MLTLPEVQAAVNCLTATDRRQLTVQLIENLSMPEAEPLIEDNPEFEDELKATIRNRLDEINSGQAKLYSREEARRMILADDDAD